MDLNTYGSFKVVQFSDIHAVLLPRNRHRNKCRDDRQPQINKTKTKIFISPYPGKQRVNRIQQSGALVSCSVAYCSLSRLWQDCHISPRSLAQSHRVDCIFWLHLLYLCTINWINSTHTTSLTSFDDWVSFWYPHHSRTMCLFHKTLLFDDPKEASEENSHDYMLVKRRQKKTQKQCNY